MQVEAILKVECPSERGFYRSAQVETPCAVLGCLSPSRDLHVEETQEDPHLTNLNGSLGMKLKLVRDLLIKAGLIISGSNID